MRAKKKKKNLRDSSLFLKPLNVRWGEGRKGMRSQPEILKTAKDSGKTFGNKRLGLARKAQLGAETACTAERLSQDRFRAHGQFACGQGEDTSGVP